MSLMAVVFIATGGPTALTGNLITSPPSTTRGNLVFSLLVFPSAGFTSVLQLAVTGNVFVGLTSLSVITRVDAVAPLNTWVPFNSNN